MSQLVNVTSAQYHRTGFSNEITLHPMLISGDGSNFTSTFDSQLYLPIKNNEFSQCIERLRQLNDWPKNWDGCDAEQPNVKAIHLAVNLLRDIFDISYTLGRRWVSPNISADSHGDVLLEWWGKDDKKITLYLNKKNEIEYIKSWSANVNDMDSDILNSFDIDAYQELFGWLGE